MKQKKCGIYALTFGKEIIYIGQSVDIERRFREHMAWQYRIKEIFEKIKDRGRATSGERLLYEKCKFIGEHREEIGLKILEECSEFNLKVNEAYWINKYKPKFNYEGVVIPYGKSKVEECAW